MSQSRSWLGNNWLVAILGGALATVLGTYAYAYIDHGIGSSAPAVRQSSSGPILIQVDPDRITAASGTTTIKVYVTGLTPDGAVEGDVYDPNGSTYYAESTGADTQGDWTFSPRWSPTYPEGGPTPIGDYRITILDKTTGATATAIMHVVR